jgi:nitrogen-specific signal transduction histidine kinase/CheY-like chemotaxis protein
MELRSFPVFDVSGTVVSAIETINDVTEKRKLEAQLRQAQKMEAVGTLAGGVAHDFNNMLMVIIGHAELALQQMAPDQPLFANLQEIRKAAGRSADLTRQLLAFARKQTVVPRVLDLNETVEGMLKMLRRLIGEDIDLTWLPGTGGWPIKVDPSQIDQILANLCVNARDAIAGVGKVTIETRNAIIDEAYCADHPEAIPGEYVLLAVSDDGCGMDKQTLDKIFEPFFTTKETGKGTGLGLATVYGIAKQNNGFVNVYSEPGQGSTFKIYLPRDTGKSVEMPRESPASPVTGGHETILLAEDEAAILDMVKQILEDFGYRVLAASTPGEAIRVAKEYTEEIHLLITDMVMPEMNGHELAKNLLSLHPKLKCLYMSGYSANVIARHGVLDEGTNFIQKPFSMQAFAAKVREALDGK